MERMLVIVFVVAAVLTIPAVILDVVAIEDWRQNAIDTAAMIGTALCLTAWLIAAIAWLDLKLFRRVDKAIKGESTRKRATAARGLRRLSLDPPTQPLTVPTRLRRIK
jgi:hypothetical protein